MLLDAFVDSVGRRSMESPGSPALYFGDEVWSYRDLWSSATGVSDRLRADGLRPGRPVGLLAAKSPDAVAAIIGAGLAGIPVLLPSCSLGDTALHALLEQTGSSHLISLAGRVRPGAPIALRVERTGGIEASAARRDRMAGAPLILTTSGSTGSPKIVPLAADGVERFFGWAATEFGICADSAVLSYAPLNFDLTLLDIWTTLWAGGAAVLVDQDRAAHPRYLRELLQARPVRVVQAVPLFFRLLAESGSEPFPQVRNVIVTGDVLAPPLLAALPLLFPNAAVHNLYGCTETNDSMIHRIRSFDLAPGTSVPIGRPIAGVHAELVDGFGRVVTGPGTGELLVYTPFQSDGYLDEALTADRFVTRFVAGARRTCYRTGDVVRRDADGRLHLEGRDDFHVKVRGVRTSLQEVEHVLERHGEVIEAAVVALPDEAAGHRLHAMVRVGGSAGPNSLRLRSHCSAALPRTAIPSSYDIGAQPLPRTSTGKVDRNAIRTEHLRLGA